MYQYHLLTYVLEATALLTKSLLPAIHLKAGHAAAGQWSKAEESEKSSTAGGGGGGRRNLTPASASTQFSNTGESCVGGCVGAAIQL